MKLLVKRRILLLLLICSCALFVGALTTSSLLSKVNASPQIIAENYDFDQVLNIGQTFNPPSAKIEYGGDEYDAIAESLIFPDGKAQSSESYLLTQSGVYSIKYSANISGKIISVKEKFVVSSNVLTVSGNNSSVRYGHSEKADMDGIIVKLASGDKFTYGKPINLYDYSKNDNFITLYALPEMQNVADVNSLYIRLTDAFDPNNYVDVVTYGNYGDINEQKNLALYTGAAANGQPLTGIYRWWKVNEKTFIYQNELYSINRAVRYNYEGGYPSYPEANNQQKTNGFSFVARSGYGKNPYELKIDLTEKQFFGCTPISGSNGMIADLDEPLFYDNLWSGFTTGEVYLSIFSNNYVNSNFEFILTNIGDEDLSNANYLDQDEPYVTVDTPDDGKIPNAIVGTPYRLFDATAFDVVDGAIDCKAFVYRSYHSSASVMVSVKNGQFIPDKAGEYSIVYRAVDRAGNVGEKVIDIYANESSLLDVSLEQRASESVSGKVVTVKHPEVVGANGSYTLKVTATIDGTDYSVNKDDDGEYTFMPLHSGLYTIKYECTDYNQTVVKTYELNIDCFDGTIITDVLNLPKVFVKGAPLVLPELPCYDLSSGSPIKGVCDISYKFDDGQFIEYQSGSSVTIEADQKLTVKYYKNNAEHVEEYPVTDVGYQNSQADMKNYFYGKDFSVSADSDGAYYYTSKDNSLYFVNKLLATDFKVKFKLLAGEFDEMTFVLTDVEDKFNVLNVSLKKDTASTTKVSINGTPWNTVSMVFKGNEIVLNYNCVDNTLTIDKFTYDLDGLFGGLNGRFVYLETLFKGVTESVNLCISQVNNQALSSDYSDYSYPAYYVALNNDAKKIGDEIILSELVVGDVLSFYTGATVTIKSPSGENCYSVDNVLMKDVEDFSREYVLEVDEIGRYRVILDYTDGNNGGRVTLNIEVSDHVAPVITIEDPDTTASVGKNVSIADYEVTDNIDTELTVRIFVMDTKGSVNLVEDGEFKAEREGVYTVMYYVLDSAGNLGFASYEVVVD